MRTYREMLRVRDMDEAIARAAVVAGGTSKSTGKALLAYVNEGRWVADCVCGGGVACGPDSSTAVCYDCGTIHKVRFPSSREIATAEEALAGRPPRFQHWRPDLGEKASALHAENVTTEV